MVFRGKGGSDLYRTLGSLDTGIRHISETFKNRKEMIDLLPYFGGLITLLFSLAFYWGLQELKAYGDQREDQSN